MPPSPLTAHLSAASRHLAHNPSRRTPARRSALSGFGPVLSCGGTALNHGMLSACSAWPVSSLFCLRRVLSCGRLRAILRIGTCRGLLLPAHPVGGSVNAGGPMEGRLFTVVHELPNTRLRGGSWLRSSRGEG